MNFYPTSESCQIRFLSELYEQYFGCVGGDAFKFVEVGAYDGYGFSNTWGLAERGWYGVAYEPVPEYYTNCRNNHVAHNHKVVSVMSAIGAHDGLANLYLGGPSSTLDKETLERNPFGFEYDPEKYIVVQITTLDLDLPRHDINPGFELLCIDVEGAELQVLDGISMQFWMPKMIIIETHIGVPGRDYHAQAIIDKILGFGYIRINDDALNTIFWHPSYRAAAVSNNSGRGNLV